MALSVITNGTAGAVDGSSGGGWDITIPLPGSLQADDIILVGLVIGASSGTISAPAGYNAIVTQISNSDAVCAWYWKRHSGSESNPNFTLSAGGGGVFLGSAIAIRGALVSGTPFEDATTAGVTNSNTISSSLVTATGDDRLAVCMIGVEDDTVFLTYPTAAGWTSAVNCANGSGTDARVCMATKDSLVATGDLAAATMAQFTSAEHWGTLTLLMIPEPEPEASAALNLNALEVAASGTLKFSASAAPAMPSFACAGTAEVSGPWTPMAALRQAANTTTGTQDFTFAGLGTPKAALVIVTTATNTDGTPTDGRAMSVGVTDGTYQGGMGSNSEHNVGTTVADRVNFDDAVVRLINNTGSGFEAIATFDSWITDGIRLNWTTAPSTAVIVHVILWAGNGITVACGSIQPPAVGGGSTNVNLGFRPDMLISLTSLTALNETLATVFSLQMSIAVDKSPIVQRGVFHQVADADATTHVGFHGETTSDGRLAVNARLDSIPFLILAGTKLDSFDSNGFTVSSTGAGGTGPVISYLAVDYGGRDYALLEYEADPSTGISSYTGAGFKPEVALMLPTTAQSAFPLDEDGGDAGTFAIAFAKIATEFCVSVVEGDNLSTTDNSGQTAMKAIFLPHTTGDGIVLEGGLDSFQNDGFDLNFAVNSGHGWRFLTFFVEEITSEAAPSMPSVEASLTGEVIFTATATTLLGSFEAAAAALEKFLASAVLDLPMLVADLDGSSTSASGAVSLAALEASLAGLEKFLGSSALLLPALEASLAGLETFEASAAVELPFFLAALTGTTGTAPIGSAAVMLAALEGASVGEELFTGLVDVQMPSIEASLVGLEIFVSSGAALLAAFSAQSVAELLFAATSALTIGPLVASSLGKETFVASAILELPFFIVDLVGFTVLIPVGTVQVLIPSFQASLTGAELFLAAGAISLPAFEVVAVGQTGIILLPTTDLQASYQGLNDLNASVDEESSPSASYKLTHDVDASVDEVDDASASHKLSSDFLSST